MSTSCRRLVLPLWLPTRPTGNLRPATALYRHGLSRRQLALCRPHQRPGQIGETPSSRPTTESHLPLSIASRFQRDPHTLSLNVFTEYLQQRSFITTPPSAKTWASRMPALEFCVVASVIH